MNFKIKITNEEGINLQRIFSGEAVEYELWGLLDIYLEGRSFFENFRNSYYGNSLDKRTCFTSSTVSQRGIAIPIEPILISLLEVPRLLEKEGVASIEDYTGQIDKKVVCQLKGEIVNFAILQDTCNGYLESGGTWYDGNIMSLSEYMPLSKSNTVRAKDFVEGCTLGVREYLISISNENPEVKNLAQFQRLARNAGITTS